MLFKPSTPPYVIDESYMNVTHFTILYDHIG